MFKYTRKHSRSQESRKKILSHDNAHLQLIANCTDSEQVLLNAFLDLSNKFTRIYITQKRLAQLTGFSRTTVNKAIHSLHAKRLLHKMGRFATSCLYWVPLHLFTPEVRHACKYILPALQFVSLLNLYSFNNCQREVVYTKYYSYFKNINTTLQKHDNHVSHTTKRIDKLQKMEGVMEVYGQRMPTAEELIPKYVQNLRSVTLTMNGQVWLSAFPESVIKKADEALNKTEGIGNPFGYLMKVCIKLCEEMRIKPDWKKRSDLANELHASDNSEMITSYHPGGTRSNTREASQSSVCGGKTVYTPGAHVETDMHSECPGYKLYGEEQVKHYGALSNERLARRKATKPVSMMSIDELRVELAKCEARLADPVVAENLKKAASIGFADHLIELNMQRIEDLKRRIEDVSDVV